MFPSAKNIRVHLGIKMASFDGGFVNVNDQKSTVVTQRRPNKVFVWRRSQDSGWAGSSIFGPENVQLSWARVLSREREICFQSSEFRLQLISLARTRTFPDQILHQIHCDKVHKFHKNNSNNMAYRDLSHNLKVFYLTFNTHWLCVIW